MCDECVPRGRALLARLPSEEQRLIRLALEDENASHAFDRGMRQGEDDQRQQMDVSYKRTVVPAREALIAAANDAARSTHLDATAVLDRLIANVRRDADRIPLRAPT